MFKEEEFTKYLKTFTKKHEVTQRNTKNFFVNLLLTSWIFVYSFDK